LKDNNMFEEAEKSLKLNFSTVDSIIHNFSVEMKELADTHDFELPEDIKKDIENLIQLDSSSE